MDKSRRVLLAAAAVAVLAAGGCVKSYRYADFESYVRPGTAPQSYRRAAVLYVGFSQASMLVQKDAAATATTKSESLGSEQFAADVVLYSNALVNALSRRGVTLVERNKVNDLVREQGLIQQELIDLSDLEKIRRIGKLLKVDLLVRGSVIANRGGWSFTASLFHPELYYVALTGLSVTGIDTRTGQVVWIDTMYLAQRITPAQINRKPELTNTSAVNDIVDEMAARFFAGGVR
jgi:hypothetical protein